MTKSLDRFLDRIDRLIDEGRAEQATILAASDRDVPNEEAVERARRLLGTALVLLADLGPEADGDGAGEPWEALRDLLWMGRHEIRHQRSELEPRGATAEPWRRLAAADAALERSEHALVAIEAELQARAGTEATDRYRQRLETSLDVRRLYAALRGTFLRAGDPADEDLQNEIWGVATQLEAIRRRQVYGLIRIDDRRQLRTLQARTQAALAPSTSWGPRDLRSLWRDLEAFSRLLMAIDDRVELRLHHLAAVTKARQALRDGGSVLEVASSLRSLLGRHDELDRILLDPAGADRGTTEELLAGLETELRQLSGAP